MKFSLEKSQHYVSYVRGKSNILQVFDTKNDSVVASLDYSDVLKDEIKGLVPYGDKVENLKHLLIDVKGNAVLHELGEPRCNPQPTVPPGVTHAPELLDLHR